MSPNGLLERPRRVLRLTAADQPPEQSPSGPRRFGRDWWRAKGERALHPEPIITFVVVLICVLCTFKELNPSDLFANTTPAGGDMGAHVWLPQFLKEHLLGHLRVTGWTPDWYDGFPALTYYFPLPMWAIAFLSYVLPYNIAFKLVTVAGCLTMPICAWAFGRLARMPFPGPACLAVAATGYLFCRDFTIYGGNIASTMAGEFSFSISLSFALLFLGVTARGLRTGRHRGLAAVLLFCCALCHILPMFFAVGGAVVLTVLYWDRRRTLRWLLPTLVVGGALTAFWSLPFEYRLPYATNMGYQKITTYNTSLFPVHDIWLFVLATVGIVLSLTRRRRLGTALFIMLVLSAIVFRIAPQARLWNARVLPFWFLLLYFLAGVALCEVGTLIAEGVVRDRRDVKLALLPVPVIVLIIAYLFVGFPLRVVPFGTTNHTTNTYHWLGISSKDDSFVPSWVSWNYSGYQSSTKAREKEYFSLINTMERLGKTPGDGCGQADWEYEPELDQMGTPDALMLLPYWTSGCIGSMEGLYYESSATTPYHFLDESQLSVNPADPERGLDYSKTTTTFTPGGSAQPNVAAGVAHLQMLGVKYYMALTPETQSQASADPALTQVASVGPFPVTYTDSSSSGSSSSTSSGSHTIQRTWKIYKVADSQKVVPLANQPVVMKGVSGGGNAWLNASESWYLDPSRSSVYEAASGPKSWARVSPKDTHPLTQPLPPVKVSNIKMGSESINFNVNRTGVPVLVRESYFPNWKVSGAKGVYRVTPNLMVVIPTSTHVHLHYGYTPIDWLGFLLTLAGIAAVILLALMGPARFPSRQKKAVAAPADNTPAPQGPAGRAGTGLLAGTALAGRRAQPTPGGARSRTGNAVAGPPDPGPPPETHPTGAAEPFEALGAALGDAMPEGRPGANSDIDSWLGHPGGLDVARYYATPWEGRAGEEPRQNYLDGRRPEPKQSGQKSANGRPSSSGSAPDADENGGDGRANGGRDPI